MQRLISNKIQLGDTFNPAKDYGGVPSIYFFLYMTINLHFTLRKNIDKQNYTIARYQYN